VDRPVIMLKGCQLPTFYARETRIIRQLTCSDRCRGLIISCDASDLCTGVLYRRTTCVPMAINLST
jgi:hypothetical protein